MNSKIVQYSAAACVCTFIWEHIGQINDYYWKPSLALNQIRMMSNEFFKIIGKIFGAASSYFWYLNLGALKKTVWALTEPVVGTLTSFCYMGHGWYDYVSTFLGMIGIIIITSG